MVINSWEEHEADTWRKIQIEGKKTQNETYNQYGGFLAHKSLMTPDVHGTKFRQIFEGTSCSKVGFITELLL